jgi:hypothetical protein
MKTRAEIALERLDEVAATMERRWGIDRLPRLVSVDLAEKFHRQAAKLDEAILGGSPADQEYEAGRMVNAWVALNAAAEAAGCPEAAGGCMSARMADGRLAVVVRDLEACQVWRQQNADLAAAVWTVEEFACVVEGFDLVNRTKHLFEGATVSEVRAKPSFDWKRGDEMPEHMKLMGAG